MSSKVLHTRISGDWSSDVCFCFSSRRRHTRYIGDWSSDVCSSDLCKSCREDWPMVGSGSASTRECPGSGTLRRLEWHWLFRACCDSRRSLFGAALEGSANDRAEYHTRSSKSAHARHVSLPGV